MLFNSLLFVAFLAAVWAGYQLCPSSWRRAYLLAASLAYYATWSIPFAGLLIGVTAVAYVVARRLERTEDEAQRRWLLTAGLAGLLTPLVVFKYMGTLAGLADGVAWAPWVAPLLAVGPIGVSYYTLKLVSYVVEVYWQRLPACREFGRLVNFAAFFPQILSGPIQRAGTFLPQLERMPAARPAVIASGLRLLLFGFFKKLVVADRIGALVDPVYAHPMEFPGLALALAAYLFAIQLYADFSGLTDIARGAARVLGIASPRNFDAPFHADNIQDFWRRWHMTLTSWVGDYVFTPLRMALRDWGDAGLVLSLGLNMTLIGLWHGPRWTYVVFGLLHAAYLVGSTFTLRARRKWLQRHAVAQRVHAVTGPFVTFHMVVASFVLFRANTLADGWHVFAYGAVGLLRTLAGNTGALGQAAARLEWTAGDLLIVVGAVAVVEVVDMLQRRGAGRPLSTQVPGWVRWAGYYALFGAILILGETHARQFIYAEF